MIKTCGWMTIMVERHKLAEILRRCSKNLLLGQGVQVHGATVKMGYGIDLMINNDLVDMYGKCGRVSIAHAVFDGMADRNVVSWTALMCGYLLVGSAKNSLLLLRLMGWSGVKPNEFTFSTNFKACGFVGVPENGMQIHGWCSKTGFEWYPVVANSIMDMYSRCGRIREAARLFDKMSVRSLVSWNVMIAGYALGGMGYRSLVLFKEMQEHGEIPDEFTFTSTLKACNILGAIREGTQIHAFLITEGFPLSIKTILAGALVDLYVSCGYLPEAQRVFDEVETKTVISWTALILGYAQEGNLSESMNLFRRLRESSIRVDGLVLSSIISVFADFALIDQGKQMHSYSVKVPCGLEIPVANSVVDMYLKCGFTEEAERFFSKMPEKNVISWTVMITGYGKHGLGKQAIHLFRKMQLDGIEPDGVTYLALLSACSHSGLIEHSRDFFRKLSKDRQIKPNVEHYACMVDILGRSGRLSEAKNLIESMPLKPNIGIWQTLLGACRVHKDMEMGRKVGEVLLKLDSSNPVNYVMMSNMCADSGYWRESERLRKTVVAKGLKKEAGRSWVEIDKEVHFFYNNDETHPLTERIHEMLIGMEKKMKEKMGYAHKLSFELHDVEEESKEESLRVHSEKLAIGLALVCGGLEPRKRPIRIFKNLRVCGDCHEFIKCLSKILNKVFLVRDANRFHKFEDGLCSCGDYW